MNECLSEWSPREHGVVGSRRVDESLKRCASGCEHINGAAGKRATWMGRPERVSVRGRARIKQCDMDKRSAAESRDVGTSSQKLGQPSDLQLLQKTFDRMK
ncbi:MAG: hypothetical protein H0U23_11470 [Blastocatellia bacterium]|nr:hypothetical protein [Blastocatellia bacterium]